MSFSIFMQFVFLRSGFSSSVFSGSRFLRFTFLWSAVWAIPFNVYTSPMDDIFLGVSRSFLFSEGYEVRIILCFLRGTLLVWWDGGWSEMIR